MYLIYSVVLVALGLLYLPVFLVRKVWRAGYPVALRERFGFVPLVPGADRFWVHAVSVGEVMAAVPLVQALRARWPKTEIVVSTVTGTGAEVARARLGAAASVFTFPLDLPGATRRAVVRVRPRCFVALETELWPNLLRALGRARVPATLANGRISDRSYRRYRLVRPLFRRVLSHVGLFAMQSEEDARRIISLGARPERVMVTGNLKMEAPTEVAGAEQRWRRLLHLGPDRVVVAGSTHRGEEGPVLDALLAARSRGEARLRLVLAPRHPERLDEVEALVRARGLSLARRSRIGAGTPVDVIVLDTVGELAELYAVADVIFVGGSLVPAGGHNVIEPALHAKPVLFGPHMANFRAASTLLLDGGAAVQVGDGAELAVALARLLADEGARRRLGMAAWRAVQGHQGACARTIAGLETLLGRD
ncbi:MAG: 3-deoxy-D-manno-octulosonic acid transferase [Candidatus Rokuibacteriota bacterium]|nr:MAG: 3-deoxy-D-manno-octulosonic acid transferase [Candidatus Rokubacteria bacterium]